MKNIILALLVFGCVNVYGQERSIKITNTNSKYLLPRWSPVEDLILFISDMEGKKSIYIIDSKGDNIKRITSLDYDDYFPSWSPDGKQIAYSSKRGNGYQIFIYDLTTNTQKQLTFGEFDDIGPSWSPDGKQVVYSSKLSRRNVRELFVIDVDGGNKKRLTYNKKLNGPAVFSTDGETIFFQSNAYTNTSSKNDILSYNLSTSKIERITHTDTGGGIDPFIYAPNNELAFFAGQGASDGGGTYWIDLETGKMTKFDIKARSPGHPTWSHDGKYVTIIDRKLKEIHIYDIANSKSIKVTDKAKINRN